MDRIEPIGFPEDYGRSFLFYGETGSGKTTLWSSFPKPILVLICSGGQKPGELLSIDTPEMRKVVDQVPLRSPSEMNEITHAIAVGALHHKGSGQPFRTVVLDHVSGFETLKLMAYKGFETAPQQKYFGIATKPDWAEIAGQLKEHLVRFLGLDCHKVIIAQEKVFKKTKGEDTNTEDDEIDMSDVVKPKIGAAVIPSFAQWLNPACDYVVQLYKRGRYERRIVKVKVGNEVKEQEKLIRGEGIEFCARIAPHDVFMGKFRIPGAKALPEALVLGDSIKGVDKVSGYDKIMKLIREGKI